jgi:Flp pilus assembly protein TadG
MTFAPPAASRLRPIARFGRLARRFLAARRGATAVEMALVATPFFMMLMGIVELGMIFLVASSLENATAQAARTIRTGEMQTAGGATASTFKTAICNDFGWLQSDCTSNLSVDVRTFASFQSVTAPQPITNKTFDATKLVFTPGGPGDIVVVRAYYQWPLIAPGMTQALAQLNGGKALLTSTATFRNEPYGN